MTRPPEPRRYENARWEAEIRGPWPWWHLFDRYYVTFSRGLMRTEFSSFAMTFAGAERKARRICRGLNRDYDLQKHPRVVTS
jgi:hypothetical protein